MTKEHSLTPYEKSLEELKDNLCPYCLTDKRQRNPTGLCDHLYYPEAANPDCIIGIAVNNYERLREENERLKEELKIKYDDFAQKIIKDKDLLPEIVKAQIYCQLAEEWKNAKSLLLEEMK